MCEKQKERGKEAERRWTVWRWVCQPEIACLPGQHCHQLRPVLSLSSLVFSSKFLKEWWWMGLHAPGWFSCRSGASCLQTSVSVFRMALTQATTQHPQLPHSQESLFSLIPGVESHTPLQARSSQPQHHLTTPLSSLMKTSPLICEKQRERERERGLGKEKDEL